MKVEQPEHPDTALPREVARALYTTEGGLAQMRYRGTGPKYVKVGGRVLYRWTDVYAYLDANTMTRTDDQPRAVTPQRDKPKTHAARAAAKKQRRTTGNKTNSKERHTHESRRTLRPHRERSHGAVR